MQKIYISGTESNKEELKLLFGDKVTYSDNIDDTTDLVIETTNYPLEIKLTKVKELSEKCTQVIPILTSSLCVSVSEQCTVCKYPEKLVGIGVYPSMQNAKRIEVAPSKITNSTILEKTGKFFQFLNINYSIVPDRVGLIFPRILAMIINEAAQVYDEKIASREDIDTAMKLGTNYTLGPLEWADKMGIELVYNILTALQRDFGDDRYRPHTSLKEMVNLGKKFYDQ